MANKKPDPNSPTYRKPVMAGRECSVMTGSTACLTERGQFPEYEAWLAKQEEKQS